MSVQLLEAVDAEEIYQLASEYFPEELHLDLEDLARSLRAADAELGNFSVGLLHQGRLQAYMLAWLEDSRVEGNRESVVLVDEVLLHHPDQLPTLFRTMVNQLDESDLGHLAIEGTLLPEQRALFESHQRTFRSLGYERVASHLYFDEQLEVELLWVRYQRPEAMEVELQDEAWEGSNFDSTSLEDGGLF